MSMIVFLNVALIILLSILSTVIIGQYQAKLDQSLAKSQSVLLLKEQVNTINYELLTYLKSKSSSSINQIMISSDYIQELTSKEAIILSRDKLDMLFFDLDTMLDEYLMVVNDAIESKRAQKIIAYQEQYKKSSEIKSYIIEYIKEIESQVLEENYVQSNYILGRMRELDKISFFIVVVSVILSLYLGLLISNNMVSPIIKLSKWAQDISRGDFNIRDIEVDTEDELRILANTFNEMKNNIQIYIEKIHSKADTEAKLKEKELDNLRIKNLLDSAELYALQSQINPHFLFNTINAGVQMAMIEGANRTSEFFENMAHLFRYNIRGLNSQVTIGEEIENIRKYYELLRVRYTDLIRFEFNIDEQLNHYYMPPLTLQPLVENAIVHGLGTKDTGGIIKISVVSKDELIVITIEDDGVGISKELIDDILALDELERMQKKETKSIGLSNVINRLELFYHSKNVVYIESELDKYTKIILQLPKKEKE